MKCQHLQGNITLADRSKFFSDRIDTVLLLFFVNENTERFSLFGDCYYSKLDTKLIFLGILDRKKLGYS